MRFACPSALLSRALPILAFTALAAGLSAQTTRLKPGKTVSGDLSEGPTRVYSVRLKTNQYLNAVITQPASAVAIELSGPDGEKELEVDAPDNPGKPARIVWVADAQGEYRISVTGAGRYEINLDKVRKAGPQDRKRVEAERAFTQGLSEAGKYDYGHAVASFGKAADVYREIQDPEAEGDTLFAAGSAEYNSGHSEKAIGYFEQALAIRRQIKNRAGEGIALKSLGNAYFDLSQQEKAIGYQEQALAIFREVKDSNNEGRALTNIGNVYYRLNEYDKAIGYYERGLAISREVGDQRFEAGVLMTLGATYANLSQHEKSVSYNEQALAIARKLNYSFLEGRILTSLGWVYDLMDRYEKSIDYYQQALAAIRQVNDLVGEGTALLDMALTFADLGDYQQSINYNEQALAINRQTKQRWGEGKALENLGWAYTNLQQYDKSVSYHEQALEIEREIKDREGEGETLNDIGFVYAKLKQSQKSISYQEQALAVARDIKDRVLEARALKDLGVDYEQLGQYPGAIAYYFKALAISREMRDPSMEAEELAGLMDTAQASGLPHLGIFYGKQAVNTVQSMRSDIRGLSQDLQRSFLKDNEKPYHTLAELLIAQGRLAEAEQVLALLKEEEYFEYIRREAGEGASLNRRADLTPEEADYEKRYREIGDRLMTIGAERGELLAKKALTAEQSQQLTQLERDLSVGNEAFEHFLGELTQHFSAKPQLNAKVVDELREEEGFMEDLRELPAGTVAIYTLAGEDKFHLILRTPDAQKAYEVPIKAADLNRKVFEFREALGDPKIDPRPLARELYQILIAPIASDLRQAKAQTLMWSLDGALRYVPIAALYDGQQYLIEQYRVSVMTLASNARLKDRPDSAWSAAGFGVTKKHDDSAALPEVAAELKGVQEILHGEIKLDEQFTESTLRATLLKRYPVVHIASHFRFMPGDQSKSFLLLGDGGHLSLAELKTLPNLFSGVQLLTLSACNTGVGDGAEVEGFGTLAQRQGAKAVIASLWPVADASTSKLMQEFYRIRESSPGIPKLEALREAQLELLRGDVPAATGGARRSPVQLDAPYTHPFYWAPFFLMGNWL